MRRGSTITKMNADCGRCLMNLEYVRVNSIDGEDPGHLFGTVRVHDGWYTYTFYDRSSGDRENVGPGGFATLTDPSHPFPVSSADAFTINVDLSDRNGKAAREEIVWDPIRENVTFANYDKHLQRVVRGEYGDVTVGYSVISDALGVTIQVLLEDGDGESPAEVYGTVRASQVLGGSAGSTPITLFDKSSSELVEVRKGQPIPLTRRLIAASTSTKLTITADLWESQDDVIAQGSVDFTVQTGTQMQYINGRYRKLQVVITCQ